VTLTFMGNLTWSDNVPVTAKDYQFSLYAWNLAGDSGAETPVANGFAAPSGLIASKLETAAGGPCSQTAIPPAANACLRIVLYIGSNSYWNLASVIVGVMPEHILGHFVTSALSPSPTAALDLSQPVTSTYTNAGSSSFCPVTSCHIGAYLPWMTWLPNIEVGSGPYYLYQYKALSAGGTGAAVIAQNLNYYRFPWSTVAALPANLHTGAWTFSTHITEFVRTTNTGTSTATTYANIYNHVGGNYPVSLASFTVSIYTKGVGVTGAVMVYPPHPMSTSGTTGIWSASIPKLTACAAGSGCEIVVTGHFTFQGLPRTWYSYWGYKQ